LSRALRLHGLKFETGLASGEVKYLDEIGVIPVLSPCQLVKAGQANYFVVKIHRHNFTPDFVWNIKIKFVFAAADLTALSLKRCRV